MTKGICEQLKPETPVSLTGFPGNFTGRSGRYCLHRTVQDFGRLHEVVQRRDGVVVHL